MTLGAYICKAYATRLQYQDVGARFADCSALSLVSVLVSVRLGQVTLSEGRYPFTCDFPINTFDSKRLYCLRQDCIAESPRAYDHDSNTGAAGILSSHMEVATNIFRM
ncbi:uncharacterized protein ARMOST_18839 [Armillaria ostoyae]|uniref:Uncharacterized protein n=1 Tax=Armillaria ostoyae TaxID=47428 RepID=A0A284S2Y1_ARMOS|nr:uncharacterized protein ARMOST_18839 [Armillaria ostoyae]